jgi:hypothetical protein
VAALYYGDHVASCRSSASGIYCRLCPAAVKVAVGLHSSMRLAAVLAVANSTVLVLLAAAAEGLVLTLAGEGY